MDLSRSPLADHEEPVSLLSHYTQMAIDANIFPTIEKAEESAKELGELAVRHDRGLWQVVLSNSEKDKGKPAVGTNIDKKTAIVEAWLEAGWRWGPSEEEVMAMD